jgi:hypothetical protein
VKVEFSKFINLEDVNDVVYNHIHELTKCKIREFIKNNQRSMNLYLLLDEF